jgi:pimeloyl-ACP methyl ester carboxylesterase
VSTDLLPLRGPFPTPVPLPTPGRFPTHGPPLINLPFWVATVTLAVIDRGEGPTVVLLHGQPGSGSSWRPVLDRLAVDHRVLAPDRPGYAATPGEATGLAGNADAVAELLLARSPGKATIVAHSWSGGVAVLLADRYPDLVSGLVLVGAACTPDSLNALDRLLTVPGVADVLTVAGLIGIGWLFPRLRPLAFHAPRNTRDWLAASLPDLGVTGDEHGVRGRSRRTFLIEQRSLVDDLPTVATLLGTVSVPVEVATGAWDLVVPPKASATLARAVPGAALTVIPRAGHFVARDDPDALVGVVRRAVARSQAVS